MKGFEPLGSGLGDAVPVFLSQLAKAIFVKISGLSWSVVVTVALFHFVISWAGLRWLDGGEASNSDIFWYFYITTATTVGYGDFSPATSAGRLVTTLWIMPGSVALFTTIVAKTIQAHSPMDGERKCAAWEVTKTSRVTSSFSVGREPEPA